MVSSNSVANLPKGVYDQLVTQALRQALEELPAHLTASTQPLSARDAIEYLAREVAERTRRVLRTTLGDAESGAKVMARANEVLATLDRDPAEQAVLTQIAPRIETHRRVPVLPLSHSSLVTNDQHLNYHRVLRDELLSADRVDLICPFIGTGGVNLIFDLLRRFGDRLRVITTTYLGGTHLRALERLAESGAQVKIVYERPNQKTALHAKAWIFHRDTGFTTATIGSSNISPKALADGLEWNVRVGAKDTPQVLQGLVATFERLWSDPLYEAFDPQRDSERVRSELAAQSGTETVPAGFFADLVAHPHQVEALDALAYARLDGRHRNLIVAATGTGKTLLAAFDYQRLAREWKGLPTLLFVAHREDILQQSANAFRAVLRDGDFGELHVGSHKAQAWKHVFASVQSLAARDLVEFEHDRFAMVVIDEFHHAESKTYRRLLDHFQPRELLGLTATPERTDGNREQIEKLWPPAFELRLWHALERRLLCPFHYFGIDDRTDLSGLNWKNGRYDDAELERALIAQGRERADLIVRELKDKVDPADMRVVAFCATIEHAKYMEGVFFEAGLEARALHSGIPREDQRTIVRRFRRGELPIVCTVDLFNEGVDIPEINTVLFLRPTESATVFIQQLGRGLRNHAEKGALTVLDFVGQQNKKFRMDLRFRAMTGLSRSELEGAVRDEFPRLPPGCDIRLDRMTTERVLKNLREALPSNLRDLVDELRRLAVDGRRPTVGEFLEESGLEPEDLYRPGRSYLQVQSKAGLFEGELPKNHHRIGSLAHADDRRRLAEYRRVVRESTFDERYGRMLAHPIVDSVNPAAISVELRQELGELFDTLHERALPLPMLASDLPFALHARYNRDEIVTPFRDNPKSMRQGTFYVEPFGLDVHLVTLRKTERHFSESTRYDDWFEAPDILHWESQSTTTAGSRTGQRLIHGMGRHLFFVREQKDDPFLCVGFATPISNESEKPIRLKWKLAHVVPDHIYVRFQGAAG